MPMTRLVLLNGAPASGKSTLARRYAAAHPLALALDIDVVRGMLGDWLNRPIDAGLLARAMALRMVRAHLGSGHDVVVPQFLGRTEFAIELEQVAAEVGVEFVEVVLLSSAQDVVERFSERSMRPGAQEHRDATALQDRCGGLAELPVLYQRLLDVVAARPRTRIVRTVVGEVESAYRDLLAALGE